MLNFAERGSGHRADVLRPFPSRLVCRAAYSHAADVDDLEFSFFKQAYFIRILELLQDDFEHSGFSTWNKVNRRRSFQFRFGPWDRVMSRNRMLYERRPNDELSRRTGVTAVKLQGQCHNKTYLRGQFQG